MKKVTYVPGNAHFVVDSNDSDEALEKTIEAYLEGVAEWRYHMATPDEASIRDKRNYEVNDITLADLEEMFESTKLQNEGVVGECLMFD